MSSSKEFRAAVLCAIEEESNRTALLQLLQENDAFARVIARRIAVRLMQTSDVSLARAAQWCGMASSLRERVELFAWQKELLPRAHQEAIDLKWLRAFQACLNHLPSRL